ncbi:MarR family transcriptional regulator [Lutibacter sp.]|uniref:MarR family winged helix-turn-helix transcriptional regulator n=1 Tax=Lutibacter sp. TaxID=1925666 RepID=UPI0025B9BFAA|nr:MarR family transcriptional regulator [Lutibacter sp.]MCF6168055.1 MarR family transcriptional regulator [Lutibacter sp.]
MGNIAKDINSTFPNERVKALINIKYTANWLDTIGNELLKPFKISVQQYNILRILRGAEEAITVSSIRKRMIQKSPNATRLMDKLCDKELIERTRCENDRRIVYVKISEQGLKLLAKINIEEFNNHMNNITEDEAETLNKILDKIR